MWPMGLLLNIVLGITISRKDLDLLQFLWPLCHIGLIDCMLFFLLTRIFHSFEDAIHYVGEFQLSGGVQERTLVCHIYSDLGHWPCAVIRLISEDL